MMQFMATALQYKTKMFAILALSFTVAARADIVVHEQLPNGNSALNADQSGSSNQHAADDFTLISEETITSLSFWGLYSGGPEPLDDLFTIRFYADDEGVSTLLHSTPVMNLNRDIVGTIFDFDEYEYSADLLHPFNAEANTTYWISIRNNTRTNPHRSWAWETGGGLGNGSAFSHPGSDGWQPNVNDELAFKIFAIPSPGLIPIAGLSAALLTSRNRRYTH